MLEGVGRVIKTGRSIAVRLPKSVAVDSAFPFEVGEKVQVSVSEEKVYVTSLKKT